jgi:hypothetical protein
MDDPLHVDSQVSILELGDLGAAPETLRKEREGVARDLLQDRVVVPAG